MPRNIKESSLFAKKKNKFLTSDLIEQLRGVDDPELTSLTQAPVQSNKNIIKEEISEDTKEKFKRKAPGRVSFNKRTRPSFVMLGLENADISIDHVEILKNISVQVASGDKVGLVGANGAGKSTILRALVEDIKLTRGSVVKSFPELSVAILRQEFVEMLNGSRTIKEELLSVFRKEMILLQEIRQLEAKLEDAYSLGLSAKKMEELTQSIESLQDQLKSDVDMDKLDHRVEKIISQMGLDVYDSTTTLVSSLSGGWKMRIGLAKVLLLDPDIVLFDEPTNHLDLDSVIWLENFLAGEKLPIMLISHDREFLDRVCNRIVEVDGGRCYDYLGNYSKFLERREERIMIWTQNYDKQMKAVREEEEWIQKAQQDGFQSSQVKQRQHRLQEWKLSSEYLSAPPKEKRFRFVFPWSPVNGQRLVEIDSVCHGYSLKSPSLSSSSSLSSLSSSSSSSWLFEDVSLTIEKQSRWGFVGPNGCGKSTLLRLIAGIEEPKKGNIDVLSPHVKISYYAQDQADLLPSHSTILEVLQHHEQSCTMTVLEIRQLLAQFMFKGDSVDKTISMLSGGEKARVALCMALLEPSNLLLLDEPTNHLDVSAKEVLEYALENYPGAVIVISHDRYFLSRIAHQLIVFDSPQLTFFDGDYLTYLQEQGEDFADKVQSRRVEGDTRKLTAAVEPIAPPMPRKNTKNFGGSGVTCGNLNKGIKNAKRNQK